MGFISIRGNVRALWLSLFLIVAPLPFMSPSAWAVSPDEILSDPVLEKRARKLSAQLRCLVCQNQSIDDSDAPLAKDLRILVRERLKAGDSDQQVIDFIVKRYGEFVLLKPVFAPHTLLLWLSPLLILIAAGYYLYTRSTLSLPKNGPADPLSEEEAKRLEALLNPSTPQDTTTDH